MPLRALAALCCPVVLVSCGGSDDSAPVTEPPVTEPTVTEPLSTEPSVNAPVELYPDVIDASAVFDGETWTVSATLSSPYDSPERYADGWRVVGPDGTVFGERILTHDHATEQPFTRSQAGIEIPATVDVVTIEGRDQVSGYGGATLMLTLPR